ncbi:hypothetical protein Q5M85_17765 [Paraclostridium bifermentans]|nr:hypothetical protein [Paraclostridium bifermentans]
MLQQIAIKLMYILMTYLCFLMLDTENLFHIHQHFPGLYGQSIECGNNEKLILEQELTIAVEM